MRKCGAAGSASGQTACPVSPKLRQSRSRHGNASPLHPSCPSPPLLPVRMNVYFLFPGCRTSLPFNFLSVLVVRGGAVCLPTPLSATLNPALSVYLCANVGPQGLLVVRLPALFHPHSASLGPTRATRVLSAPAARLRPSYLSGSMFIFYSLGVRLPCRSIFCQFWLCEEAQCVYLRCHLGSPGGVFYNNKYFNKELP